jgi:hypothetical protein
MVPNHMGIDSRWVIDHPSGSCSLAEPPYPAYPFNGADLSTDERVGIVLEDHYWDDSDAAVVFKRFGPRSGRCRYVYHGNDGTSFPWNDTAQLNFIDPGVASRSSGRSSTWRGGSRSSGSTPRWCLPRSTSNGSWWPEPGPAAGSRRAPSTRCPGRVRRRMPAEF